MADNILNNIKIKHRSDIEANWASQDPVLLSGELAISSDKSMYKAGDGASTWSQLPYNGAVSDSSGDNIRSTYLKNVSVSGQTLTLVKGNGNASTITTQDTKNTTGSTNSGSKLFLIGASSQAVNPQTYSRSTCYVGTDGCLYSNSNKVSVDGHTHSYLPLSGGTMSGSINVNSDNSFDIGNSTTKIRNLYTHNIETEAIVLPAGTISGIKDSISASAISTSNSIVTERDVYYGLPKLNNSHSYTSSSSYYAPTSGGIAGYEQIGAGTTSAPIWKPPSYAVCSTAASTTAKTVSITNFKLVTGCEVTVKFTYGNSASSPTLNVYSTGAKPIYYKGTVVSASYIKTNDIYKFVYDGTHWSIIGDIDTASDRLANYLPLTGGTADGQVILSKTTDISGTSSTEGALVIGSKTGAHLAFDGNEIMAKASATTTASLYLNNDGGQVYVGSGGIRSSGEIQSTTPNAFRAAFGKYGFFIRNDSDNTYFLLTNSGDPYGSYNGLRPVLINNATGKVQINGQYPLRVTSWDGTTLNLTYG